MSTINIRPLTNYVLIKNPIKTSLIEEMEEKVNSLPPKDREEYIKENHKNLFENIQVIEVGEDVENIKAGDIVVSSPDLLRSAITIESSEYLLIRSTQFVAKNVGKY